MSSTTRHDEADAYDEQSIHCLLRHRPSGLDTGCVRLVLPLAGGGGLPFENYGLRNIDRKIFDWKKIDSRQRCEISRMECGIAGTLRQCASTITGTEPLLQERKIIL